MTQYLDWKVGDRVVCIDDSPAPGFDTDMDGLRADHVYTIRKIAPMHAGHSEDGKISVWLSEIYRPLRSHEKAEIGFNPARFRKVHPRKTSIAIFERLLNTQNNEVETA